MAESYSGHVQDGVIVPDAGTPPLPEGTKVRFEPAGAEDSLARLSEDLLALAGVAEGLPEDLAENLDHYLRGIPKR